MTPTVLGVDASVQSPEGVRPVKAGDGIPGDEAPALSASGFTADTWVFFAVPHTDWTVANHWALGFGPVGIAGPSWSLFRCVSEDRFESSAGCPHPLPFDQELLRWATSVVGPSTATLLFQSVGNCFDFYRRYFSERPDLDIQVGR